MSLVWYIVTLINLINRVRSSGLGNKQSKGGGVIIYYKTKTPKQKNHVQANVQTLLMIIIIHCASEIIIIIYGRTLSSQVCGKLIIYTSSPRQYIS